MKRSERYLSENLPGFLFAASLIILTFNIIFLIIFYYFCISNLELTMLSETIYRIALQYLPQYTPTLIKHLIREYGTATDIFLHSSKSILRLRKRNKFLPKPVMTDAILETAEREAKWMAENGVSICFYSDHYYPQRMKS
ncbi:hypothetical protein LJB75_01490, partial [Bacteroidales bacterium OttesenSCG-928-L19]|nr:hypothetical protein [Bacteroidales bacterium OttesenSCG-928-L19]